MTAGIVVIGCTVAAAAAAVPSAFSKDHPATHEEAIYDVRRRIGERNGTEQVRWRVGNMIDSSGVDTADSDTCVAPG